MAQNKKRKRKWIWIVAVLILLVGGTTAYFLLSGPKPVPIQTGKVKKGKLTQVVSASGKVNPAVEVEISANIAGEIIKLNVREGEDVQKDQILVLLDNKRYSASTDQAMAMLRSTEANIRQAAARLEMAERTLKRQEELYKQKLISKETLEAALTERDVAKAGLDAMRDAEKQAQAGLHLTSDELSKTIIRSPMDGKVTRLDKEEGEIAMGSQFTRDVIMVISDPSRIEATVDVDEADVVEVALGDPATVEVDALPNRKFDGKVIEIAGSATTKMQGTQEETVSFKVKVLLEGETADIRPGMSATADIITDSKDDVFQVPIQCVTMRDPEILKKIATDPKAKADPTEASQGDVAKMKELLFAVKDHRAVPVWVTTGISSETDIEVSGEGLAPDMEIVCGNFKTLNRELKPNDLVEVPTGKKGKDEESKE